VRGIELSSARASAGTSQRPAGLPAGGPSLGLVSGLFVSGPPPHAASATTSARCRIAASYRGRHVACFDDFLMDDNKKNAGEMNEGEGNKTTDRHYREGVREHIDKGDVDKSAREAARDIDEDPEGYAEAERIGKSRIAEESPNDKDLI
jgi:hypothetical protein